MRFALEFSKTSVIVVQDVVDWSGVALQKRLRGLPSHKRTSSDFPGLCMKLNLDVA